MNKPRILVVDDDVIAGQLLAKKLEKNHFECQFSDSGVEALRRIPNEHFDMVLLDIHMPIFDGFEVLQHIRQTKSRLQLPIIMITASDFPKNDTEKSLEYGANDFISKPIDLKTTIARIDSQITLSQLYKRIIEQEQLDATNTMIATFNHEINNPLTVALAHLNIVMQKNKDDKNLLSIHQSLTKMISITKEIAALYNKRKIEKETYTSDNTHIIKLNKSS